MSRLPWLVPVTSYFRHQSKPPAFRRARGRLVPAWRSSGTRHAVVDPLRGWRALSLLGRADVPFIIIVRRTDWTLWNKNRGRSIMCFTKWQPPPPPAARPLGNSSKISLTEQLLHYVKEPTSATMYAEAGNLAVSYKTDGMHAKTHCRSWRKVEPQRKKL